MISSPSLLATGFVAITVAYFALLLREFRNGLAKSNIDYADKKRILTRIFLALSIWAVFVTVWSASGRMSSFSLFPFNIMPVFVVPLLTIIAFTFSRAGREILTNIPQENLVRLQSFRIFVELVIWGLVLANQLPVQMSFEGRNFDVISGLTAPLAAFLISRHRLSRRGIIAWNLICLGLLVNILGTAILSMPTRFQVFMNEPSNTLVATFPASWLPGFLVPLAYGLHFFSLRQLALQEDRIVAKT